MNNIKNKIYPCIVGLGYIGLPIFNNLKKKYKVCGFDINKQRIDLLKKKIDTNNEFKSEDLNLKNGSFFSNDMQDARNCNFFIIAVPTPVNSKKIPDLNPLIKASKLIGEIIKKNDIVFYESTVYPGVTEETCIPILEKISNLKNGFDFEVGYSPERLNPGDQQHSLNKINKIVSFTNPNKKKIIKKIYKPLSKKIIFSKNIKEAETAKVIENIQRDVNIGLINEIFIVCKKLKLNFNEVIRLASTKWNFVKYEPGLVGGHCLPVDPYYFSYLSKKNNIKTKITLAGRNTNDNLVNFVIQEFFKYLRKRKIKIKKAKVLVVGLTYKSNVSDIRNSLAMTIFKKISKKFKSVIGYDPVISKIISKKIGAVNTEREIGMYDIVLFLTKHEKTKKFYKKIIKDNKKIYFDIFKNNN